MSCKHCHSECSGLGRCDVCYSALCFICANFPNGVLGNSVRCDDHKNFTQEERKNYLNNLKGR
jgi:hypothetical protein